MVERGVGTGVGGGKEGALQQEPRPATRAGGGPGRGQGCGGSSEGIWEVLQCGLRARSVQQDKWATASTGLEVCR